MFRHQSDILHHSITRLLSILIPALAVLSGCTGHHAPERVLDRMGDQVVLGISGHSIIEDEIIELQTAGRLDVRVDSMGGDVDIIADPKLDRTYVSVSRIAMHGHFRAEDREAALEEIDYRVTLEPSELGDQELVIKVDSDHQELHFVRAHVRVDTPALDAVNIRTRRGSVWIQGAEGDLDIQTSQGDVVYQTNDVFNHSAIIVSSEGGIDFRVPPGSEAAFDAETYGGDVEHRITHGRVTILHPENDHNTWHGVLNKGTNKVILRTTDGEIRIAVVENPHVGGAVHFDP